MLDTADRKKIELIEVGKLKLKARRKQLFELFVKHPDDFRMSLEIKKLDDQIAELTAPIEPRG